MNRRDFIRTTVAGALAAALFPWRRALPKPAPKPPAVYCTWRNWAGNYDGRVDGETLETIRRGMIYTDFRPKNLVGKGPSAFWYKGQRVDPRSDNNDYVRDMLARSGRA